MTDRIGGLPYWEIEFEKTGALRADGGALQDAVATGRLRDLFIFSHGWNSSRASAQNLYRDMFGLIADMLPPGSAGRTGIAGVLWPSLLFPEDEPADSGPVVERSAATQSLGAFAAPAPAGQGATPSSGGGLAQALTPAFPGQQEDLARIGALLDQQPQDPDALTEFHALVNGLVSTPSDAEEDSGESQAMTQPAGRVFDTMAGLAATAPGDAQALNPFKKLWAGAREVLRTLSYYEMKNRAGVIGRSGLGPLLAALKQSNADIRVHLMGHSFGARLISFALAGLPADMTGSASPVKSLLLIQGAFSHFSFASQAPVAAGAGTLAPYVNRVDGPLLATFSDADRAIGWWYPNASRFAWQDNQAIDEISYRWGGMGKDGYQQDNAETRSLSARGTDYGFQPGHLYRLNANAVINRRLSWFALAHSDIRHPEVAWAAVAGARLDGDNGQP
jgi:hypothetical protein